MSKEKPNPYQRIKLAEIELSRDETPELPPGYDGVRVLVRLHHEPVGYVNLNRAEGTNDFAGRARTELVKSIKRHLEADGLPCGNEAEIEASLRLPPMECRFSKEPAIIDSSASFASSAVHRSSFILHPSPFITIAVCTRNRADQLEGTLQALKAQTYDNFEVLVIDNAPSDNSTRDKLKEFTSSFTPCMGVPTSALRYVVEMRPGLDWARNRAIQEAQGAIIAYTDDDARPDPDWLEEMARAFTDPQVDAMTGLVVPAELETAAQLTFEDLYGGFGKGFERKIYHRNKPTRRAFPYAAGMFGAGCNMAFRTEIFKQMGGFDEALDVGTLTGGGGDMDIFIRVLRDGFTLLYEPRAVVRHLHRREMEALEKQLGGYARAFFAYLSKWAVRDRHRAFDIVGYAAQGWLKWILIKAILSVLGRNGVPKEIALIQFRNAPLGPLSYRRARRRAERIRKQFSSSK